MAADLEGNNSTGLFIASCIAPNDESGAAVVRPFRDNDLPAIIERVLQNRQMKPTEIEECVNSSTTWVFKDEVLIGRAAIGQVCESQHGPEAWPRIHTAPNHRR